MTGLVQGRLGTRNPARELSVQSSPLEMKASCKVAKPGPLGAPSVPNFLWSQQV